MKLWQNYVTPGSVSEALNALASGPAPAFPLAGGTDLLLDLEQGRHSPAYTLVDLSAVVEMTALEVRNGYLFVGAAVPLSKVARDPLVMRHARALVEASDLVGGPQVRNVATLGGNVAHALPAADGTIALLALDALAEMASLDGNRQIHLAELFVGPGKSALKAGQELIVGFRVPLGEPPQGSCFRRIMRPQGVALPIINVAVWLERRRDLVRQSRIAVGPGGPMPWRALDAEHYLAGKPFSKEVRNHAVEEVVENVRFRTSPRRASEDYRRHLVADLLHAALISAWDRSSEQQD